MTELNGLRKSAVLLLSLNEEEAAEILNRLPPDAVDEVNREIASLREISPAARADVCDEFCQLAMAESVRSTPFGFLQGARNENLLTFIQNEHPQTIALILAHLPPANAGEILAALSAQDQIEVVKRIANMGQTHPDAIEEVERGLAQHFSADARSPSGGAGGIDVVAEILNHADRATGTRIMESIGAEDPDLVEQIGRLRFVFEDVLLLDDAGIQAVLDELEDRGELSLALSTASQELKDAILRNLPASAARLLSEDIEYAGPVSVSDVESAQQKIVEIVRRLEDAGEIVIAGGAND